MTDTSLTDLRAPDRIIFGGAFDPPHLGHYLCVRAAQERFPDSQVMIVPTYHPPRFGTNIKVPKVPFEGRLDLCQILFSHMHQVVVDDMERDLPQPSYSLNTVLQVHRQFPQERLAFLLGEDQAIQISRWHRSEHLLQHADLIIVPRSEVRGTDPASSIEDELMRLGLTLSWTSDKKRSAMIEQLGSRIFLLPHSVSNAKSTLIRERMGRGEIAVNDWLSSEVVGYIRRHHLYQPEGV